MVATIDNVTGGAHHEQENRHRPGRQRAGQHPYEQLALVTETAKPIVDLIAQGNEVIIAHGNGPQVGMINLGMATAAEAKAIKSECPSPSAAR